MGYIEAALGQRFGSVWHMRRVYHEQKPAGTSTVYHAVSDAGMQVAVKRPQDPILTRVQYSALCALSKAHSACVRPLHLDRDNRFFAMEWIAAPTFRDRMLTADRLDMFRMAGSWLAELHRATRAPWPSKDIAIEAGLQAGDNPRHAAVDRELARRRQALWIRRSRLVLLHTDYQLNNLFLAGDRAIGFDPAMPRRGHRYFDVAHFLLTSRMFRHRAAFLQKPWPGNPEADEAAFLDAYGPIPAGSRATFDFVMDLRIARSWRRRTSSVCKAPVEAAETDYLEDLMRQRGLLPTG